MDAYDIPATWAVVAYLLIEPDDPRALPRQPQAWYHAPYLLDTVCSAHAKHEIGTHTFSHVYTDDPAITREVWRRELNTAAQIHRAHGLPMRSIVYPRNLVAYTDTLADYGVVAYRGIEQNWYGNRRGA